MDRMCLLEMIIDGYENEMNEYACSISLGRSRPSGLQVRLMQPRPGANWKENS